MLYTTALAAPHTVTTLPEPTLRAFADHGEIGGLLPAGDGDAEQTLVRFAEAGLALPRRAH
ncbi:MAG TPA: transaldolase, partial [Chloroflexota bacterium]|nr:transaldolase [Chloroflexota bacterium]